jgi:hypothetical protein
MMQKALHNYLIIEQWLTSAEEDSGERDRSWRPENEREARPTSYAGTVGE